MTQKRLTHRLPWELIGLVAVGVGSVIMALHVSSATVAAQDPVCRAAIVLDRSGSVTDSGLRTMKEQVKRLFQAPSIEVNPTTGGLYTDKIHLAFWTFANMPNNSNYNAPFNGFVSSRGTNSSFDTNLSGISIPGGAYSYTNYMHGMGYVGNTMNSRDGMDGIINQADVIVFMTDGEPNKPASGNSTSVQGSARQAGRTAALKHVQAGKTLLGGFIQGRSQSDYAGHRQVNYLINGNYSNYNNTFDVNASYNNLAQQLKTHIADKCDVTAHPCPTNPAIPDDDPACVPSAYVVTPNVTVSPPAVSPGESVQYRYTLTRESGNPPQLDWYTVGVRLYAGADTSGITKMTNGYQDTDAGTLSDLQNEIIARAGGTGRAAIIESTPSGNWRGATLPPEEVDIPESARAGEKYCRILVVAEPTERATPTYRYSAAACANVGFKPSVQVNGGDIVAGRSFLSNTNPARDSKIHTSISTTNGRVFGSFGEYGVRASGTISGMASVSALRGGVETGDSAMTHKLIFANTPSLGRYNTNVIEHIPDAGTHLRQKYNEALAPRLSGTVRMNNGMKGLYVASGDLRLEGYTFVPGQTIIVYAPKNKVTISGDITYPTSRFTSVQAIPQMVIIADDISILGSVNRLDSWLVAQGESGIIDTCSDAPERLTASVCSQTLTVNGPVMAQYLLLKRTAGERAASGVAAEVFNLRADAYLWAYNSMRSDRRILTTHTIELSPRF